MHGHLHNRYRDLLRGIFVATLIIASNALPRPGSKSLRSNAAASLHGLQSGPSNLTTVTHPSGASNIILFHATNTAANALSVQKPNLTMTQPIGELHDNAKYGVAGGMYLTDSVIAAAQFVCWRAVQAPPEHAYVLKFIWTPPANLRIFEFKDVASLSPAKSENHDMITGPMDDKFATKDFWQYALVQQAAIDAGLKYADTFRIPCKVNGRYNVYKGKDLPERDYIRGQGNNPEFYAYVETLVSGQASAYY